MRRDSIFYALFQQFPGLLFELLDHSPSNAQAYRFDSVAVKEPKFEIDGVFLPPETGEPGTVYFCEVQFQKDEQLYERLFGESFLYFYRNRDRFSDWEAVVIYPSRSVEQANSHPYRVLLRSDQVHRIYLDELGDIQQLPLGLALMVLTNVAEVDAPAAARELIERTRQEASPETRRAIIEMIATIMVYKLNTLNRREIEEMLGLALNQTRVYQEAKEEGREEEARSLICRQLTRRLGDLPGSIQVRIGNLSVELLEMLGEALLDFSTLADLEQWLEQSANSPEI